jgi:hypothetical protein
MSGSTAPVMAGLSVGIALASSPGPVAGIISLVRT